MNQTLRPQPQLGEVLPGALTLGLLLVLLYEHEPETLNSALTTGAGFLVILAGGFLFASWIAGTLLDTIRDGVIEGFIDRCSKKPFNWDFFFTADQVKVAQLDEYYYSYYQSKAN